MCCGDPILFDFQKIIDRFNGFNCVGKVKWPVLYDEQNNLIMVYSPVGIKDPNSPMRFRTLVDSCLTEWVNRVTSKKSEEGVLLLLGWRNEKSGKAAIRKLLEMAKIVDGKVKTKMNTGEPLLSYLKREFNERVGFVIHPSQLTDKNLKKYVDSAEGREVKKWIEKIQLD